MVRTSISRRLVWLKTRRPLASLRTLFHLRLTNLYLLLIMFMAVVVVIGLLNMNSKGSKTDASGLFSIFSSKLQWPSNGSSKKSPVHHSPWGSSNGSCQAAGYKRSSNNNPWIDAVGIDLKKHHHESNLDNNIHNRIDPKVLVFVETQYSPLGKQIVEVLEASRIRFKLEMAGKSLPILTNSDKGKFAVIIFENLDKYIHMNKWNRELIDKYCREYSVGIIGFLLAKNNDHSSGKSSHEQPHHEEDFEYQRDGPKDQDEQPREQQEQVNSHEPVQVKGFPLFTIQAKYHYQGTLRHQLDQGASIPNDTIIAQSYHVDSASAILRITKPGTVHSSTIEEPSLIPGSENWILFRSNHSSYHPVTYLYTSKTGHKSEDRDSDLNIFNEHESKLQALSDTISSSYFENYKNNNNNHDWKQHNNISPEFNSKTDTLKDDADAATHDNDQVNREKTETINEFKSNTNQRPSYINYENKHEVMTIIQDDGSFDGIERIMFGSSLSDFWIHKLLLLDSISFLSHNKLALPLNHYLLIDIDDIFVGESGSRMKKIDVIELLSAQKRLESLVRGFKFNLGFSGKYYHRGTDEEDEGDDFLIEKSANFWWFCHMWSHSQPHLFNATVLEHEMTSNLEFAKAHKLPSSALSGYSIAPHHSGVYPVHEPLYDVWKRVLNIRVTSTEEYPHLRPARLRRGFIYQGISVLPRQTCGLYTHTIFLDKYPGGSQKLINSVKGGELFYTLIYNPINIFMTHLSNYGNDRLALFTFESAINFLQCWTNINLSTLPPNAMAKKYFQAHPEESDPVWINPCLDKRHHLIWSNNKSCDQLPKFLVIGPQKTGTTALYTFLLMHPTISSSHPSPDTFEEVQFFNGKNYYKGLDWYMNFFPPPHVVTNGTSNNSTKDASQAVSSRYLFEKSATYFDGELVPLRVHSLLPSTKIVTILISPVKRAYSWYQHVRAHRDVTALNYSFYDVITANEKSPRPLRDLRNRCLNPGLYNQHLEHWFTYFSPAQVMIIDGDELRSDPATVMARLQNFLKIEPFFDYAEHLRFDSRKGFYCQVTAVNGTKCLGRSKGRNYETMDEESEKYLRSYYMSHNVALSKLLTRIHSPIPPWLEDDLSRV